MLEKGFLSFFTTGLENGKRAKHSGGEQASLSSGSEFKSRWEQGFFHNLSLQKFFVQQVIPGGEDCPD